MKRNCSSCGALVPAGQWEACAVDGCEICGNCWERYGYAAFHTDAEIKETSLLAAAPRWPESIRREARERRNPH